MVTVTVAPIEELQKIAEVAVKSNYYKGLKTTEQALAKILYGWEMGLPPMASLTAVYVMTNKEGMVLSQPALTAAAMATLIKKAGYKLKKIKLGPDGSEIEIKDRDGETLGTSAFTLEDAKRAELTGGPNSHMYRKYPANMLWSRNIANIARQECSDVFGGAPVYTPEEMDIPVDADGNPLDGAEHAPSLRQQANEELAAAGQPPMLTKEEAKAAGVKSQRSSKASATTAAAPLQNASIAPITGDSNAQTSVPVAEKGNTAPTAPASATSQGEAPKPDAAPTASEPSNSTATAAGNVSPATQSTTERPVKADKDALLQLFIDNHKDLTPEDAKKAASSILSGYLTEKKVVPDGVPMKELLNHWTWEHYNELKGKMA